MHPLMSRGNFVKSAQESGARLSLEEKLALQESLQGLGSRIPFMSPAERFLMQLHPVEQGLIAGGTATMPSLGVIPALGGIGGGIAGYKLFPKAEWMQKYLRHPLVAAALGAALGFQIPKLLWPKPEIGRP